MQKQVHENIKLYIIAMCVTLLIITAMFSFQMLAVNIILLSIILIVFVSPTLSNKSLIVITLVMIFQNFLVIILNKELNQQATTLIILYKEIYVYLSIIISLFITNSFKTLFRNYKSMFVFGVVLLISLILSHAPISVRLVSFRQIIIPIVTFVFGYSLIINKQNFDKIIKFIIMTGVICCVFGIVEMYFLPSDFWINIGINNFLHLKGFDLYVSNDLPANMYTYDLQFWTGQRYRRMASFFADPLLFSHFVSLCVILLMFNKKVVNNSFVRKLIYLIMIFCIVSTFSKGALLIILCGFMVKFYKKNKLIFVSSLIAAFVLIVLILGGNKMSSVVNHVNGLITNVSTASILGNGLGTAGNFAILYSDAGADVGAGESMIGTILGQLGIVGLISYLYICWSMLKKGKKEYKLFISAILIGIFVESFLSESAISFNGSGLYFMLVGVISKASNLQQSIEE